MSFQKLPYESLHKKFLDFAVHYRKYLFYQVTTNQLNYQSAILNEAQSEIKVRHD